MCYFLVLFILNIDSDLPISQQVKQNILWKIWYKLPVFPHCVNNNHENNDSVKMIQLKK